MLRRRGPIGSTISFFFIEKPGIPGKKTMVFALFLWKYLENLGKTIVFCIFSMKILGKPGKNNGLGIFYMKICGKRWNSNVFYAFSIQKRWKPLNFNVFCIFGKQAGRQASREGQASKGGHMDEIDQFLIKNRSQLNRKWKGGDMYESVPFLI